ncbi:MAG: M20/M25/M40 family metallo-hydrolase [Candidatus Marinimicrobia bacterium]|nr:M20/M25/M40 family metallo-hydrolase [Candidatus Neomarinimicrobiota bacterium]MBL7011231.1 M20/M25/M40 family metallo-hydrolase [Candidatus Neomarinimicrobiota bacterium]MBL7031287.1 M20/M25/M40 family metallo-hydrolase [Candidatus Neomarinimicrobiota bacterium]
MIQRIILAGLIFCTSVFAGEPQSLKATRSWVKNNGATILKDFAYLLSMPNVASDRENIRKNAEYIRGLFQKRGFEMQLLEIDGANPIIYGEYNTPGAKRTLCFYVHYDGQPVDSTKWMHGPFEPILYDAAMDAEGKPIPFPEKQTKIDPEWRIYGRSAGDDKAPIMTILNAVDALQSSKIGFTSNIKLFFEGEEEAGSINLKEHLIKNKVLLDDIDIWLFCDGPMHQSRQPQLVFGVRGVTGMEITVYGAIRSLHSGHYGNWAPVPGQSLAHLIASMKDETGKVLVDGFYDTVEPLSEFERLELSKIPDVDIQLKTELGLAFTEGKGRSINERLLLPSLTIKGLSSGNVGKKARNVIPSTATAAIGVRLVKGNDPIDMLDKVEAHIRKQGFHIVYNDPDMETRRKYQKIAKVNRRGSGYIASRTSMEEPNAKAIIDATRKFVGDKLILMPALGGSLPIYLFTDMLQKPAIIIPIANHDNNQHAANENLRIANLWYGIDLMGVIMTMRN